MDNGSIDMAFTSAFKTEKWSTSILFGAVLMNLAISILLARNTFPAGAFTLRVIGGFFLLVFVCLHGWHRYGWNKMIIFFTITFTITWFMESLSIETGIPFGKYHYTELLGDKIGNVPVMIMAAYFFNGYLAWTMGSLFVGNTENGISRRTIVIIPVVSSLMMFIWNACFDPVMSTIEGHWIWHEEGPYHGVPLSNFAGWFITGYLVFQAFALYLYKTGEHGEMTIRHSHWYFFPAMYMVQGLPGLLYPFFRPDHPEIYRTTAQVTLLTMFMAAILNMIIINFNQARITGQVYNDG